MCQVATLSAAPLSDMERPPGESLTPPLPELFRALLLLPLLRFRYPVSIKGEWHLTSSTSQEPSGCLEVK
jgi:hypothetical protein